MRVGCILWLSAALVAVSLFFKCVFLNTERSPQQTCTKPVSDSFTRLIEALLRAEGKVLITVLCSMKRIILGEDKYLLKGKSPRYVGLF
jgi:hypothetical protein